MKKIAITILVILTLLLFIACNEQTEDHFEVVDPEYDTTNEDSYHPINDRHYASSPDIAAEIGINIEQSPESGIIIIDTNEPFIPEHWHKAAEDFLINNYPQLFTQEQIWEDFGYGIGVFFAGHFSIYDFGGEMPVILIGFHDAGSRNDTFYEFVDGKYQRTSELWTQFFEEPPLYLVAFNAQVQEAVNKRMWPRLEARYDGIVADANIDDEIIELVITFLSDFDPEIQINEIKHSMIFDGLLRITGTDGNNWPNNHWLEVNYNDNNWEILGHFQDFWWSTPGRH